MNISELKTSRFLTKEEVETPITVTIVDCVQDNVAPGDQPAELKWTLTFEGNVKPLVLNNTNGQLIAHYLGSPESDDWSGKQVTLYNDPTVTFAGKMTGGIRVRAAEQSQPVQTEADTFEDHPAW